MTSQDQLQCSAHRPPPACNILMTTSSSCCVCRPPCRPPPRGAGASAAAAPGQDTRAGRERCPPGRSSHVHGMHAVHAHCRPHVTTSHFWLYTGHCLHCTLHVRVSVYVSLLAMYTTCTGHGAHVTAHSVHYVCGSRCTCHCWQCTLLVRVMVHMHCMQKRAAGIVIFSI